uniref:Serine/threonine-protein phosphatase 2A activator n=1 Tax=Timema tahoe TaxID=61484 RepID=A0A7R9IJU4_9NEOP|nr:unnamed protein product [Timema tahoe]
MESLSDPISSLYRVLDLSEDHEYMTPRRAVTSVEDMNIWKESEAYSEIIGFIIALNEAVKGKPLTIDCLLAEVPQNLLELLNKLDLWVEGTPPVEQPQRFGNQAFRTWFDRLKREALELLQQALPERFHRAVPEVMFYLVEGFGNSTRIDYGTGHELAFLMFLCCLFKIGALKSLDQEAVVTKVFNRYLQLVRKLQLTYRMEPAGSHGVWSLDDYQFVPFIWGSSQLIAHPRIEPRSFLQEDVVNSYADDYMFLGCIQFINKVKTGMFAEHSNQLWNISGVGSWSKVNSGLIKMYKAEVLAKFPLVQHVLFGSLLPFRPVERQQPGVHCVRMSMTPPPPPRFLPPDKDEQ